MYVGSKIKALRRKLDYTQAEFADILEVSQPYYSAIESGKKPISKKMLNNIKEKWQVDKEYFLNTLAEKHDNIIGGLIRGNIGGIDYNSKERILMKEMDSNIKMIHFLYQRIVDVRIILEEDLKISEYETYGDGVAEIMNDLLGLDIITTKSGDRIIGRKYEADDYDGKVLMNQKLKDCIEYFTNTFFSEFRKLYLDIRKMDEMGNKIKKKSKSK